MKKTLLLLALISCGCTKQVDHKAHALIIEYMKKVANDPSSYEPVSFGPPHPYTDGQVIMNHAYRAKNKAGALVLDSNNFALDSTTGFVSKMPRADETTNSRALETPGNM